MKFTASVVGGTGLVGSFLMKELMADDNCEKIIFITRKKSELSHPKIEECMIDFSKEDDYRKYIKGDVLFSSLGTTRKQAGSIENQYLVDYHYQFKAAKAASENGVKNYVLVSSPWANIDAKNYYRKMKAELERDVQTLPFENIAIIKPNGLVGQRDTPRMGEKIGLPLFNFLSRIIPSLNNHQPIEANKVAKVMLLAYYQNLGNKSKTLSLQRIELNKMLEA